MCKLKDAWQNAYYRGTMAYVCTIVTLIFGFQLYRYFISAPASDLKCAKLSAMSLIPVIGALFYGK